MKLLTERLNAFILSQPRPLLTPDPGRQEWARQETIAALSTPDPHSAPTSQEGEPQPEPDPKAIPANAQTRPLRSIQDDHRDDTQQLSLVFVIKT